MSEVCLKDYFYDSHVHLNSNHREVEPQPFLLVFLKEWSKIWNFDVIYAVA